MVMVTQYVSMDTPFRKIKDKFSFDGKMPLLVHFFPFPTRGDPWIPVTVRGSTPTPNSYVGKKSER
jgi:hypothetical protein